MGWSLNVAFCAQWAVMIRPAHVNQMALVTFSMQSYLKHGEHHPLVELSSIQPNYLFLFSNTVSVFRLVAIYDLL